MFLTPQADLKFGEIKREAFEFKRDVVLAGENTLTGKIMSERVVKYYEDALRSKEGLVDKLRLKNAVLKTQQVGDTAQRQSDSWACDRFSTRHRIVTSQARPRHNRLDFIVIVSLIPPTDVQVKLTESLKGKEEAGDVLHYIDFHQLQIENAQYLGR